MSTQSQSNPSWPNQQRSQGGRMNPVQGRGRGNNNRRGRGGGNAQRFPQGPQGRGRGVMPQMNVQGQPQFVARGMMPTGQMQPQIPGVVPAQQHQRLNKVVMVPNTLLSQVQTIPAAMQPAMYGYQYSQPGFVQQNTQMAFMQQQQRAQAPQQRVNPNATNSPQKLNNPPQDNAQQNKGQQPNQPQIKQNPNQNQQQQNKGQPNQPGGQQMPTNQQNLIPTQQLIYMQPNMAFQQQYFGRGMGQQNVAMVPGIPGQFRMAPAMPMAVHPNMWNANVAFQQHQLNQQHGGQLQAGQMAQILQQQQLMRQQQQAQGGQMQQLLQQQLLQQQQQAQGRGKMGQFPQPNRKPQPGKMGQFPPNAKQQPGGRGQSPNKPGSSPVVQGRGQGPAVPGGRGRPVVPALGMMPNQMKPGMPTNQPQPSRPPVSRLGSNSSAAAAEMRKKFALQVGKPKSTEKGEEEKKKDPAQQNPGTPTLPTPRVLTPGSLNKNAAVFIPMSSQSSIPDLDTVPDVPQPEIAEVNRGDPTKSLPQTPVKPVDKTEGVPAEQVSQPPSLQMSPKEALPEFQSFPGFEEHNQLQGQKREIDEEEAMELFEQQQFNDVMERNMGEQEEGDEDNDASQNAEGEDIDIDEDETVEDEQDEVSQEFDATAHKYPFSFLVKIASTEECRKTHECLEKPAYRDIIANNHQLVEDILNRTNVKRRGQNKYGGPSMSRNLFGQKQRTNRKKTPRRPKHSRPHHHQHQQQIYLERVDPLQKAADSWWELRKSDTSPFAKIRRNAISLLNKITLENKETIQKQFAELIITQVKTQEDCHVVVSTIFDKSCDESKFSNIYADLCMVVQKQLSGTYIQKEDGIETKESDADLKNLFRRSIINLCQRNFNEVRLKDDMKDMKDKSKAEVDEALGKGKRKMMGNIKFIGDLFKHRLIHESIVHHIIAKLLTEPKHFKDPDIRSRKLNDQLEGCCKLLTTVGKQIDVEKAASWMDQYFQYLDHFEKLSENRIKFMIQGIKDLRKMNWKPRRETETVKRKEQIRREFELEQQQKSAPIKGRGYQKGGYNNHGRANRNMIRQTSSTRQQAWGSNKRTAPSSRGSQPPGRKGSSQDIRNSGPPGFLSKAPSSPLRSEGRTSKGRGGPDLKEKLKKIVDGKRITDESELEKFFTNYKGDKQKEAYKTVLEFYLRSQNPAQNQVFEKFRAFNRRGKLDTHVIIDWMKSFSSRVEEYMETQDVPLTASYYGRLIAEFAATGKIKLSDVRQFAPQKLENETVSNTFMVGFVRELMSMKDPDGKAILTKHAQELRKGFNLAPKQYGRLAKRAKIPKSQELPILTVILGEKYEERIQEDKPRR